MFVTMVYFDADRISEFKAIAKGEKDIKIGKVSIESDKHGNLNFPLLDAGVKATKSIEGTVVESAAFECQEFEKVLMGRDDFFDFTQEGGHCLETIGRGAIIKFDSTLTIPQEFDITQTISLLKPYLLDSATVDMGKEEGDAFRAFFNMANPKIPLIAECDDTLVTSKIDSKYLIPTYEELDEYESLEVTILARVTSSNLVNASKSIYNPLKDFIHMNRTLRRSFEGDPPEGLRELFIEEAYKTIEILAIYQ